MKTLLKKSGLTTKDIRYIFAGDLLGQLIASSFGLMDFEIPFSDCTEPAPPWGNP